MIRPISLRLKEGVSFHIMSGTVVQEFYPGDVEKEEEEEIIFMTTARKRV
jgi:hypothetical protein